MPRPRPPRAMLTSTTILCGARQRPLQAGSRRPLRARKRVTLFRWSPGRHNQADSPPRVTLGRVLAVAGRCLLEPREAAEKRTFSNRRYVPPEVGSHWSAGETYGTKGRRPPCEGRPAFRDATLANLLGHPVVARGRLELLDVRRRQLRPIDLQRQLVELAGELERDLVVLVVHRRAGVGPDVEVLVPLQDQRNSALHSPRHLLAVDFEHTSAAAADTAQI